MGTAGFFAASADLKRFKSWKNTSALANFTGVVSWRAKFAEKLSTGTCAISAGKKHPYAMDVDNTANCR